ERGADIALLGKKNIVGAHRGARGHGLECHSRRGKGLFETGCRKMHVGAGSEKEKSRTVFGPEHGRKIIGSNIRKLNGPPGMHAIGEDQQRALVRHAGETEAAIAIGVYRRALGEKAVPLTPRMRVACHQGRAAAVLLPLGWIWIASRLTPRRA